MPTRRLFLTAIAAAAVSGCSSPPAFAVGSLVDVQIVDRSRGQALPSWHYRGASYVAGRPGDRYAVRLTNRSPGRVLVVPLGRRRQRGQRRDRRGGADRLRARRLTSRQRSPAGARARRSGGVLLHRPARLYAARTHRPDNVGVIGAAVFRERVPEPVARWPEPAPSVAKEANAGGRLEAERQSQGAAADAAAPAAQSSPRARADSFASRDEKKLGTGHGEREYSPTSQTAFERASATPAEIVQVRYDSYANLLASGVIPRQRPWPRQPDAFPSFVPDPG